MHVWKYKMVLMHVWTMVCILSLCMDDGSMEKEGVSDGCMGPGCIDYSCMEYGCMD